MGIFDSMRDRNQSNTTNPNGEKHFRNVIKNSGAGELLIWRQPEEDFNTSSTLIVNPGEKAIFINNGVIEEVFSNGSYKLSTENYPFITRLRTLFTGGVSTFNCIVYFVREAISPEVFWGTDSPIQLRDKHLGIATKLKARGSFKVNIDNPELFLTKFIGNNVNFQTSEDLTRFFGTQFQGKIKPLIARAINDSDTEILGIDCRIDEITDIVSPYIATMVGEYGVGLADFTISAIDVDDDELRRRYDEIGIDSYQTIKMAGAEAQARVISAHGKVEEVNVMGDNWGRIQSRDILSNISENPGSGGIAAAGAGLGMGMAAGGMFNGMSQQTFSPMGNAAQGQPGGAVPPPILQSQFHIYVNNQQFGPMTINDIKPHVLTGQVTKETLVWKEGMANWAPAGQVAELSVLFNPGPAVPPPVPPMPPTMPPTI
ncbi:MAG: SPFH domain-containing protein [Rikenellaceae bacterium]